MNKTRFLMVALLGILLVPLSVPLAAQEQEEDSLPERERRTAYRPRILIQAGGAYMGNFFQAPAGQAQERVAASNTEIEIALPLGGGSALFVDGGATMYSEFDASWAAGGGIYLNDRRSALRARVDYRAKTPRMEVGDVLGFADIRHAGGSYQFRPVRALQLEVLADYYDETYSQSPSRANTFVDVGGAVRYRGFGYAFSPEIGGSLGRRKVKAETENFEQLTLWATIRSMPTSWMYLSVRYRNRVRDYTVSDLETSNFERQDQRHQGTVTLDLSLHENLGWTLYYSYEHAESTKESRNFQGHFASTGLSIRIF